MKALCVSLGLLLLATCCCSAIPNALRIIAPRNCCFRFSVKSRPPSAVSDIRRTDRACEHDAFIVHIKKYQICYRASFKWAQDVFNRIHKTEGSGSGPQTMFNNA